MTEQNHRKFTWGMLEFRPFILTDYLYLLGYLIIIIAYLIADFYFIKEKFTITWFASFGIGIQTCSTPFGLRFRNVYFSILWLILSLVFLIDNYPLAYIPLVTFISYHFARFIFWKMYNRELIPYFIGKGAAIRHRSKIENRTGSKKDKNFTTFLLITGIITILVFFILSIDDINKDIKKNKKLTAANSGFEQVGGFSV